MEGLEDGRHTRSESVRLEAGGAELLPGVSVQDTLVWRDDGCADSVTDGSR